jgi:hypothetical protein
MRRSESVKGECEANNLHVPSERRGGDEGRLE